MRSKPCCFDRTVGPPTAPDKLKVNLWGFLISNKFVLQRPPLPRESITSKRCSGCHRPLMKRTMVHFLGHLRRLQSHRVSPDLCVRLGMTYKSRDCVLQPPDSLERNIGTIALPGSHMSCSGPPAHTLSCSIPVASNLAVAGTPQANDFDTTDDGGLRSQGSQYSQRCTVDKRKNQKRSSASSRSSTTNRSTNTGPLLLSRNEILENARERQRQLVAELECAKVELWEASIEGGVLVHLMRDNKINPHRSVG